MKRKHKTRAGLLAERKQLEWHFAIQQRIKDKGMSYDAAVQDLRANRPQLFAAAMAAVFSRDK
jgi:hypothetical protein